MLRPGKFFLHLILQSRRPVISQAGQKCCLRDIAPDIPSTLVFNCFLLLDFPPMIAHSSDELSLSLVSVSPIH